LRELLLDIRISLQAGVHRASRSLGILDAQQI
jgi:hypothetical protein